MEDLIIKDFWKLHPNLLERIESQNFINDDDALKREADLARHNREVVELDSLMQGLEFIVINTEINKLSDAVDEFLLYTGYDIKESFENDFNQVVVLSCANSPDVLLTTRKQGDNPFYKLNLHPKSEHLPNTRYRGFLL